MRKIRDNNEETQPLVINNDVDINLSSGPYYPAVNPVIMRGVSMHLAKWPSHLLSIFMTVCIISAAFIALTFVTIVFFTEDRKPRISRDVKIEEYPNVYCIKHASHAWTLNELCAIESSAREFSDLNVYMVNIHQHISESSTVPVNTNFSTKENAVSALTERYTNIRSIDIVASTFFRKSTLGKVYEKFDGKLLEIAVKSQLLWNYSGIAVNPLQIYGIRYLKKYICRSNESCKPMKNAAISTDGSVQVSPVPCHIFFEFFMKQLARDTRNEHNIVKDSYKSFCSGREKCIGVEILNNITWNISPYFTCPVIYPEGDHRSELDIANHI